MAIFEKLYSKNKHHHHYHHIFDMIIRTSLKHKITIDRFSLRWNPYMSHQVVTTSFDGCVHVLDLRQPRTVVQSLTATATPTTKIFNVEFMAPLSSFLLSSSASSSTASSSSSSSIEEFPHSASLATRHLHSDQPQSQRLDYPDSASSIVACVDGYLSCFNIRTGRLVRQTNIPYEANAIATWTVNDERREILVSHGTCLSVYT
jgi:WD40 repeat protein